eukprot:Amastigsp_a340143_185.p2 type:complete len:161 gc:universal Amastigsp_a340143_185:913-1395(+)
MRTAWSSSQTLASRKRSRRRWPTRTRSSEPLRTCRPSGSTRRARSTAGTRSRPTCGRSGSFLSSARWARTPTRRTSSPCRSCTCRPCARSHRPSTRGCRRAAGRKTSGALLRFACTQTPRAASPLPPCWSIRSCAGAPSRRRRTLRSGWLRPTREFPSLQ